MKKLIFITFFCLPICLFGQKMKTIDFGIIDTTVNPADNFYKFCSGLWLKNNTLQKNKHRYGFYNIAQKET